MWGRHGPTAADLCMVLIFIAQQGVHTALSEADTAMCPCRAEEDVGPYLPAARRSYVFGSLAAQAARIIIWLLPEVQVSLPAAAVWSVAGAAPPGLRQAADPAAAADTLVRCDHIAAEQPTLVGCS